MNRENADRWLLRTTAGLLLIQLICGVAFTGMVRGEDFLIAQGLTVLLLLLWIARLWTNRSLEIYWPPAAWGIVAFTTMALIWAFRADVPYVARTELLRTLVYGIVFLTAMHCFRSRESIRIFVFALLALALANSIYASYQTAIDPAHVWHFERPAAYGYGRRGSGFFINPNNLAILLAMILPVALAFAMVSRLKHLPKIFLGYACLVLVVGIGLTLSRGGWIATAASMFLFFIALLRMRAFRTHAIIAMVTILCLGGFFISQSEMGKKRLKNAIQSGPQGNIRIHIWETAWDMWSDHPVVGVGPGHFDVRYREYRSELMQARPIRAHNDYLNTLADLGVIGLAVVLLTLGACFLGIRKSWRQLRESLGDSSSIRSDRLALTLGVSTAMVALLCHAVFDFPMHIPGLAMLAAALLALLLAQTRHSTPQHRVSLQTRGKSIATIIALAVGVFLTWQGVLRFREYRQIHLAERGSKTFEEQLTRMGEAHRIEPSNPDTPFQIAEMHRLQSWKADTDYESQAESAISWFKKAIELDPHDPLRRARLGMCLDWLGRHDEAWPHYERALELDPRGYHTASLIGWHYLQLRDFEEAKRWFELSYSRSTANNSDSWSYLQIIKERQKEGSSR